MGTRVLIMLHILICKDHPHAYGDKSLPFKYDTAVSGSSPRVWGQEANFPDMYDEHRIIPTRMGTSDGEIRIRRY